MILNLLSFSLGGFYLGSNLIGRTLSGFWGEVEGFNYPLTVDCDPRNITTTVYSKSQTVVIDQ